VTTLRELEADLLRLFALASQVSRDCRELSLRVGELIVEDERKTNHHLLEDDPGV